MARTFRRRFTRRRRYGRSRRRRTFRTKRFRTTFKRRGRTFRGRRRRTYRRSRTTSRRRGYKFSVNSGTMPYRRSKQGKTRRLRLSVRVSVNPPTSATFALPNPNITSQAMVNAIVRRRDNILELIDIEDFEGTEGVILGPDSSSRSGRGCFMFFNAFTYIKAIVAKWSSFRGDNNLNSYVGDASTINLSSNDREAALYRYYMQTYLKHSTPSINVTFVRKTGKALRQEHFVPIFDGTTTVGGHAFSYTNPAAGTAGAGTIAPANGVMNLTSATQDVYTTKGDNKFYSFVYDGLMQAADLFTIIREGSRYWGNMSTSADNDVIGGTGETAQSFRLNRLFQEMTTPGTGWVSHPAMSTMKFRLSAKKGSSLMYEAECVMADGTGFALSRKSDKVGDQVTSMYAENDQIYPQINFFDRKEQATANARVPIPGRVFPRGTIIIWSPYNRGDLEDNYDVYVNGTMIFANQGSSVITREYRNASSFMM